MEQKIRIKTPDNHIIYGTLNSIAKNNDKLIIFVHGITGNQHEHHYFNAVPFFNKEGFNVFRFDFYSREEKARSLSESSITTHVQDLKLVIEHFKDNYKDIILIGHSLGSLVILNTDLTNISRLVFWDPTTPIKNIKEKKASFEKTMNKYLFHWQMDFLISKEMVDEWKSMDLKKLLARLRTPCKLIFAGDYNKHELWKQYENKIIAEHETAIIPGATHCFVEEGVEQKLFEETLKWIA